jgi:hypothetical protein
MKLDNGLDTEAGFKTYLHFKLLSDPDLIKSAKGNAHHDANDYNRHSALQRA